MTTLAKPVPDVTNLLKTNAGISEFMSGKNSTRTKFNLDTNGLGAALDLFNKESGGNYTPTDLGKLVGIDAKQMDDWRVANAPGFVPPVVKPPVVLGRPPEPEPEPYVAPTVPNVPTATSAPPVIAQVAAKPVTPAVASLATAATPTVTTQAVTNDQLIQERLNGLLDSPLVRNAQERAKLAAQQQMLNRGEGLLDSSIMLQATTGATENAFYDNALKIATPDAARFGSVADQNMAATNAMNDANAGRSTSVSQSNAQNLTQTSISNMGEEGTNKRFDVNWANDFTKGAVQQGYTEKNKNLDASIQATRDSVLNGYQVARDAIQNTYQVARDKALALDVTERDKALAKATTDRDKALDTYDKERAAALAAAQTAMKTVDAQHAATAAWKLHEANLLSDQDAAFRASEAAKLVASAKTEDARIAAETNLKSLIQDNLARLITDTNGTIANIKANKDLDDASKDALIASTIKAASGSQAQYNAQLTAIGWDLKNVPYFNFEKELGVKPKTEAEKKAEAEKRAAEAGSGGKGGDSTNERE